MLAGLESDQEDLGVAAGGSSDIHRINVRKADHLPPVFAGGKAEPLFKRLPPGW